MEDSAIEELIQLEESLWREESRFDVAHMDRFLADDFVEFGRSGRVYDRSEILSVDKQPINALIPLPNFTVRKISDSVVQVTYDSHVRSGGGTVYAHRSSIWSYGYGGWKLHFHQGTPYVLGD